MCLLKMFLDDVSSALCFHYYFSSSIKPEKQVNGIAENISIPFLVFLSMEESFGEGRQGADPGVDLPPPPVPAVAQAQLYWPFPAVFSSFNLPEHRRQLEIFVR